MTPVRRRAGAQASGPQSGGAKPAAAPGAAAKLRRAAAPNRVRIIGGQWRRTPLPVVEAAGLRPTPDRVRETLFNWLDHDLSGFTCLDLFAGTGALGLEAASRGAALVWLAETEPRAQQALADIVLRLQAQDRVRLHRGNARILLTRLAEQGLRAGLVFIDPPFHQGLLDQVMPALPSVLLPEAWVYVEAESPLSQEQVEGWFGPKAAILRQASAGLVHYHLLRIYSAPEGAQENT